MIDPGADSQNWFMHYYVRMAPIVIIGVAVGWYLAADAPSRYLPVVIALVIVTVLLRIWLLRRYTARVRSGRDV